MIVPVHRSGIAIALIALTLAATASAAPAACPDGTRLCESTPFYFHSGGRMDGTPGSREPTDAGALVLSWSGSRVAYRSAPLAAPLTVAAGESIQLLLHREPVRDGDYATRVVVTSYVSGIGRTIADVALPAVAVRAASPAAAARAALAGNDPRDDVPGYPGSIGSRVDALAQAYHTTCRSVQPFPPLAPCARYEERVEGAAATSASTANLAWQTANAAASVAFVPPPPRALQPGWGDLRVSLAADATIPAGATIDVTYITSYAHPVDAFPPGQRIDPTQLPRPDILNYHDTAAAPSRLVLTTLAG